MKIEIDKNLNIDQKKAVTSISKNTLVKAGAGTGKTKVLTERYLYLVSKLGDNNPFGQILAITFTNKAANNMKDRIFKRLIEANIVPDSNLNIMTIDSFLKSIVDKYNKDLIPYELISSHESEVILDKSVEEAWEVVEKQNINNWLNKLKKTKHDPFFQDIKDFIKKIRSTYVKDVSKILIPDFNLHEKTTIEAFDRFYNYITNFSSRSPKLKEFYKINEKAIENKNIDLILIEELVEILTSLVGYEQPSNNVLNYFDYRSIKLYEEILELTKKTYEIYQNKKNRLNYMDFNDVLKIATDLIDDEEIRKSIISQIPYIMIDEFQDTSRLQLEFFSKLSKEFSDANFFVVGDIKQSIYRFRGADHNNMIEFEDFINKTGGEIITLHYNYRSDKNIINFLNDSFYNIFTNYDALEPGLDDDNGKINFLQTTSDTEANAIKNEIISLIKKDYDYKSICILSRNKSKLQKIESYLNLYNIPTRNYNPNSFTNDPAVRELLILIKSFISEDNLSDAISLFRGPFFNLKDDEILIICKDYNEFSILNDSLTRDNYLRLRKVFLENNIKTFLDYIYYNENYLLFTEKFFGKESVSNIISFKNMSEELLKQSNNDISKFIELVEEDEELSSEGYYNDYDNAVQLSTIHKAKGLEFTNVFLLNASGLNRTSNNPNIILSDDYLYINTYKNLCNYKDKIEIERIDSLAEEKRMLYVAVTRAKKNLYISSGSKTKYRDSYWDILNVKDGDDYIIDDNNAIKNNDDFSNLDESNTEEKYYFTLGIESEIKTASKLTEDEVETTNKEANKFGEFMHKYMELVENKREFDILKLKLYYDPFNEYNWDFYKKHIDNFNEFSKNRICDKIYTEYEVEFIREGLVYTEIIDRLEVNKDEVNIIDYKTNHIKNESDVERFTEHYRPQLMSYEKHIRDKFKGKVIRSFLFFTSIGRLVELKENYV